MFKPVQEKCIVCSKTVYPTEKMVVESGSMHQSCFRCAHCNRQLTLSNFASVNNTLYCKVHYIALFKQSGGKYDVFGAYGDKDNKNAQGANSHQKANSSVTGTAGSAKHKDDDEVLDTSGIHLDPKKLSAFLAQESKVNTTTSTTPQQQKQQRESTPTSSNEGGRLQALLKKDQEKKQQANANDDNTSSNSPNIYANVLKSSKNKTTNNSDNTNTSSNNTTGNSASLTIKVDEDDADKSTDNEIGLNTVPSPIVEKVRRKSLPSDISPAEKLRLFVHATEAEEAAKAAGSSSTTSSTTQQHSNLSSNSYSLNANRARRASDPSVAAAQNAANQDTSSPSSTRSGLVKERLSMFQNMSKSSTSFSPSVSKNTPAISATSSLNSSFSSLDTSRNSSERASSLNESGLDNSFSSNSSSLSVQDRKLRYLAATKSSTEISKEFPKRVPTPVAPKNFLVEDEESNNNGNNASSSSYATATAKDHTVVVTKSLAERQQEYLAQAQAKKDAKPSHSHIRSFNEGTTRRNPGPRLSDLSKGSQEGETSIAKPSEEKSVISSEIANQKGSPKENSDEDDESKLLSSPTGVLKKTGSFHNSSKEKRLVVRFSSEHVIHTRTEDEEGLEKSESSNNNNNNEKENGNEQNENDFDEAVDTFNEGDEIHNG